MARARQEGPQEQGLEAKGVGGPLFLWAFSVVRLSDRSSLPQDGPQETFMQEEGARFLRSTAGAFRKQNVCLTLQGARARLGAEALYPAAASARPSALLPAANASTRCQIATANGAIRSARKPANTPASQFARLALHGPPPRPESNHRVGRIYANCDRMKDEEKQAYLDRPRKFSISWSLATSPGRATERTR